MAKVNLLTIHYGKCYGAVMQTYATCKLLEEAGHTVTVINLVKPTPRTLRKLFSNIFDCIREFQFWFFKRRYFPKLTNKAASIDRIILPEADVTVVGSDQVWNRDITGCFGKTFFLDYVKNPQKKVALSSSFGKSLWEEPQSYTEEVKKLLCEFDSISVREDSGVNILAETFGLSAINLLDPTLGYGAFDDLVLNKKSRHQVFPFLLRNDKEANDLAQHISIELGLPLLKHSLLSSRIFKGPRTWLTNIMNSEFIITDSFHGLALSLIFNKQFLVFCADQKKFTRLQSLLSLLSLEDRYIKSINDFDSRKEELLRPIDYTYVNGILRREQHKYRGFIKNTIA